jgi:hypothetical protein
MQIGLMAKLIGRPVEVKALPVTLRYAPDTLRWEAIKSGVGVAVCLGIIFGLNPSMWIAVPVGIVGLMFAYYGAQQLRRGGVTIEVNEEAATRIHGVRRTTIHWEKLETFRLHFYAFGRKAQEGTLEVRLAAGGEKIKVDSTIDHFPTLLVHASRVARAQNLTLDPTTVANLDQLGL